MYISRLMILAKRLFIIGLLGLLPLSGSTRWHVVLDTPSALIVRVEVEPEVPEDLKPFALLIGTPNGNYPRLETARSAELPVPFAPDSAEETPTGWINRQVLRHLNTATLLVDPLATTETYSRSIMITIHFEAASSLTRSFQPRETQFLRQRIVNWESARNWFQPVRPRTAERAAALPTGQWFKFAITADGPYRLSGTTILNSLSGAGPIDLTRIRLYTCASGGREKLSIFLNRFVGPNIYQPMPENLRECAISLLDDGNQQLDAGDAILFYGRGPAGFDYTSAGIDYTQNIYFTENHYWLCVTDPGQDAGKRITDYSEPVTAPVSIDYGLQYSHTEYDLLNPNKSGVVWVGPFIPKNSTYTVPVQISNLKSSVTGTLNLRFFGHYSGPVSPQPQHFIKIFSQSTSTQALDTCIFTGNGKKLITVPVAGSLIQEGINLFILENQSSQAASQPYFDYLTFSYGRRLVYNGSTIQFYAPVHSIAAQLDLEISGSPQIWDVSNWDRPVRHSLNNSSIAYNSKPDTLNKFMIFNPAAAPAVESIETAGSLSFTSLRHSGAGVQHLIIGPEQFRQAAEPLRQHRGSSLYASLEQIYREFSGGNADPLAIHSFLQWTQENWQEPIPDFALIMGDADYDYRNISGVSKTIVPTIEIGETAGSHVTDDRFASIFGKIPDLALGRYPAHSVADVENFVEKIVESETNPDIGIWRQRITLVADDAARPENTMGKVNIGKSHTLNSDEVAGIVAPMVQIQKLYMIEFPEVSDASTYGVVKPQATAALLNYLREGTSIVNYIGHGSAYQWAQEQLLMQNRDLNLIDTGMKLPLWIAGTCSWGHFDDLETEAFSEDIIRLPRNGAAGIITTTRAVTVDNNALYERLIFNAIFPDHAVTDQPIGIILQSAKTGYISGEYFQLLGDPATPLVLPHQVAVLNSVTPDTLKTLDTARVFGTQSLAPSGYGFVTLRDADRQITREYNYLSTIQTLNYTLPGGTLFRGKFTFDTNQFNAALRIPNDFSYSNDPGHLSVYLVADDNAGGEALGYRGGIPIRGGAFSADSDGPIISFLNEDRMPLYNEDHLVRGTNLYIRLSDPIGINLTSDIGHEIMLTDLESGEETNLTSRFIYDANSITTGQLVFEPGTNAESVHLRVKAWDSANNSSESTIDLLLSNQDALKLYQVYNYPNPFSGATQFAFEITAPADVNIDVFTLSGRRIVRLGPEYLDAGYHFIDWDGRDAFGDQIANGAYLYKIKAKGSRKTVSVINTCAKFR